MSFIFNRYIASLPKWNNKSTKSTELLNCQHKHLFHNGGDCRTKIHLTVRSEQKITEHKFAEKTCFVVVFILSGKGLYSFKSHTGNFTKKWNISFLLIFYVMLGEWYCFV